MPLDIYGKKILELEGEISDEDRPYFNKIDGSIRTSESNGELVRVPVPVDGEHEALYKRIYGRGHWQVRVGRLGADSEDRGVALDKIVEESTPKPQ